MATIVNTPPKGGSEEGNWAMGILTGVIIVGLIILLFMFGLPALRRSAAPAPYSNPGTNTTPQNEYKLNINGQVQTPPNAGYTP